MSATRLLLLAPRFPRPQQFVIRARVAGRKLLFLTLTHKFRACQRYHRFRRRANQPLGVLAHRAFNGFNSRDYCEQLAGKVADVYEGRPGNMRVIYMDDQGVTT